MVDCTAFVHQSNVQCIVEFQKISNTPPQKEMEFPGGGGGEEERFPKIKLNNYYYIACIWNSRAVPRGVLEKNLLLGGGTIH